MLAAAVNVRVLEVDTFDGWRQIPERKNRSVLTIAHVHSASEVGLIGEVQRRALNKVAWIANLEAARDRRPHQESSGPMEIRPLDDWVLGISASA
jgi:hypothetical protein